MTTDIWGLADYPPLAELLAPAAQALVDAVVPLDGRRVLDLAAGTGNVAVLAAEAGATVIACDSSPRMVELGRRRTGDRMRWLEADAEDIPLPDASVDAVLSAFGLIFVANPAVAVAQARRVLAPRGVLAFTVWPVDGFMSDMTRTVMTFLPPPPPNAPDPMSWGDREVALARLTTGFDAVQIKARTLPWRFASGAVMTEFLRAHSPAHIAAAQAAEERAEEMFAAIEALAAPHGGPVDLEADYLLIQAEAV